MNLIETYVFVVEYANGKEEEYRVNGLSEKQARNELWKYVLPEEVLDHVVSIDCVDIL